jgi:hypothetical protein
VVSAHADVQCLAVPVRPRPAVAPQEVVAPLVPALLTALPPPPPPAQLPNANPNVNPNVQPNINPVAVAERQHQLQVALAEQEAAQLDVEPGTGPAMSSRPRTAERDAAGALLGMVVVSSFAGVALARQRRTQLAR